MEVALSLSWLLLGLACALVSVNKLKIKLRTKTGIPGGGNEQCSQVLRVTDMALGPPVTIYRVHHTSIPLSPKHTPCSNGLAAEEGVSSPPRDLSSSFHGGKQHPVRNVRQRGRV